MPLRLDTTSCFAKGDSQPAHPLHLPGEWSEGGAFSCVAMHREGNRIAKKEGRQIGLVRSSHLVDARERHDVGWGGRAVHLIQADESVRWKKERVRAPRPILTDERGVCTTVP